LPAAARRMRGIPRGRVLPAAGAVVVTDHRAAVRRAARPVRARVLRGRAVLERAGQDVVHVRRIAAAVDLLPLLAERRFLAEVVVLAVQVLDALGNHHALGVVPGPAADAIARVDGLPAALGRRAEVCAPGLVAGADRGCELLAVRIRAPEPAQAGAVPGTFARDEEAHARTR